ncbi:MAG: hypothetical protein PUI41_03220, partial [Lachnospiraceae bacterium]|nr:hypothetical protein [Lachnospiraceae bacterium]
DGKLVFNEVNTIPGFTAHSRYPNMMKAAGMSFEQVISSLIELAVRKYANENGYKVNGFARECYIDGMWNKDNVEDWLTEIQLPIEAD